MNTPTSLRSPLGAPLRARRSTVLALGAIAGIALLGATAARAEFPDRPIRLIVPFAASGSTDLAARLIGEYAARELGQAIVVENRAGAGGSLGMEQVAKSRPDGYTLGMATMSTHGSNAAAYGTRLKYDPVKDFAPVSNVATVPSVLAVNAKFPARTMAELLAMARKEPGKITFASPGMGSLGHANVEYFSSLAKIELLHVPYKGSGMALNDAVAGQVDAITDNLPSALTHIQAGRLRALAVLSDKRSPALPDVPTYGELGFPQMGNGGWFGIVAPAGTPAPVVRRLNQAIHAAMKQPDFIKKMEDAGATLIPNTPQQFQAQIEQAVARYAAVAKVAKISAE
ncbi:tripartite tricarboxylate transporter substrate binding protein BugE [Delftia sp. DLF01]|uniref:Bug family tripartite tricarboxylate transporter substrate binding protein n=1 Tax=Delftia sp. DLF01 TaxID=2769279 RepID=UPI001783D725|nr:tripartite tricarboxylate transporter substrate binding protein BugE [Delftia sp. DLF01]MBD9584045.1 tripartite tricarboxylate transporter substrate binding protein BugE [Delftia sp. DLF01]